MMTQGNGMHAPPFVALDNVRVDGRMKGFAATAGEMALGDIGRQGWNLLRGDLPSPAAVLYREAIETNSRWIEAVAAQYRVSLCPHGKTTMAPQLFHRQIEGGCWGITLSTRHQVQVARSYGVERVFLANQILDAGFLRYIAAEQIADPEFDFYFLVDSAEGIALLDDVAAGQQGHRPFKVLIELGSPFARTGCRSGADAHALAEKLAQIPEAATLVGIEGFEGSMRGDNRPEIEARISDFLDFMTEIATALAGDGLFGGREVLLSAGGSAYFDMVAKALSRPVFDQPSRVVLRSGCYISHDSGAYVAEVARALERAPELASLDLRPRQALTVWATVQSRPEPGLCFLDAGRRDVGFDAHLPRPLQYASGAPVKVVHALSAGHEITMLNDQHAYLRCPEDSPLRPGDIVELGISHPCTTFDKWALISVIDGDFNVIDAIRTFF